MHPNHKFEEEPFAQTSNVSFVGGRIIVNESLNPIVGLTTQLNALSTSTASNTSSIGILSTSNIALSTSIASNTSSIALLSTSNDALSTSVASNTSSIASLSTTIGTLSQHPYTVCINGTPTSITILSSQ